MTLLLAEDRDQHVRDPDLLLAARLHVKDGALQHALETERGLYLALVALGQARRRLRNVHAQLGSQFLEVGPTGAQHLAHPRVSEQAVQEMLDRQELVTGLAGLAKGLVQAVLEFGRQHQISSSVHISGC